MIQGFFQQVLAPSRFCPVQASKAAKRFIPSGNPVVSNQSSDLSSRMKLGLDINPSPGFYEAASFLQIVYE